MQSAFDGYGAKQYGGRWNSKGRKAVYLADAPALAALEILVHAIEFRMLKWYCIFRAEFPDALVSRIDPEMLPADWQADPPPLVLQEIGDSWIEREQTAVLQAPSAVVPLEVNYIVNPAHPDFKHIEISEPIPFDFDSRLTGIPAIHAT